MAIKKISFNKEGLVSEEVIDRKISKPPTKKDSSKSKAKKSGSTGGKKSSSKTSSGKSSDSPKNKPVKVTVTGDKKDGVKLHKSLLEQDVIKFVCSRCSSERVSGDRDAKLKCGLCGAKMELAS